MTATMQDELRRPSHSPRLCREALDCLRSTVYDLPHHDKSHLDRALIQYLREGIDQLFDSEDSDATISRESFLVGHTISGIRYIRLSRHFAGSANARTANARTRLAVPSQCDDTAWSHPMDVDLMR